MKPLQIALLVVAGALGGAVVMKVWQRPQAAPAPAPPVVAQVETPAPAPEAVPAPAPVEPPAVQPAPVKPAPAPAKRVAPVRVPHSQPMRRPEPVIVAKSEPAVVKPAPAPAPEPPAPPQPVEPPPPTPPARSEPENVTPPPPPPEPEPPRVTLNAGMLIPVRLVDGLSSERNVPGDTFTATLYRELVVDGFVIAERGARVEGRVVSAGRGSKGAASTLSVELTRIHTSDGQNVDIQTDSFERLSDPSQLTNAEKIGGGAAVGAIIGAVAGGGKGAAIGAGVGGGAGAGDVLLTRKPATLPSETRITFRLKAPVTLTERRSE
ncbi:conserved exported hypothetical protein [Candidatus Sulfopaludibacter sp. SbA4]|nr:conserved exported hypothetical protein [Candidatus Sulfopaludibacter sp. SbA4]